MTNKCITLSLALISMCFSCKSPHVDTLPDSLDSLFSQRYYDENSPGAAILIAKGDSVLYERYYGMADIEQHRKIDENTLFNIASISKQFTVVALLQQNIDIDSPASDYFDYPQSFWHKVSIRHLASQSSGIPDSRDRSNRDACVYADDETSISYFPTVESVQFEPGTAYDYLNPSFILLAKVIEQTSGMPFTQYMQQHIFSPAGMHNTIYFNPDSMPPSTAHAYVPGNGMPWIEYDYGEETFFATRPDGGIYSTPRDLLRWEQALSSQMLLPDTTLQMAYTPHVNVSDSPWCDYQRRPHTWYGLGWFIDDTPGMPVKIYHTGDNGGFQAYLAKYPDHDVRIVVLENRNDQPRWQMAQTIDSLLIAHKIISL